MRLALAATAIVCSSVASAAVVGGTASASDAPVPHAITFVSPATKAGATPDPIADQALTALDLLRAYLTDPAPTTWSAYLGQRNLVALAVAQRIELDPEAMQAAWSAADTEHQVALLAGLSQLGVRYRRNTSKPGESFDCSGLTTYAWSQAGILLPRQSGAQIRQASPRTFDTAQAGDLIQFPGHVMMWLGVDHAILHAVAPGRAVEIDDGPNRRSLRIGDPTG
jgi:cell wall-associated NlpC family hydrolase